MSDFVLLVIDVQMAFVHRDATGADRSCPEAEQNIAALLSTFRATGRPVIHIHHDSTEPGSGFAPDTPGNAVQPFVAPIDGELALRKKVNSSFIGTSLADNLTSLGNPRIVICGGTANHCVETTTRMAGNLGYDAIYVSDGVWAYGETGPDGVAHTGAEIHSVTLANMDGEFATVLPTKQVLDLLET